MLALPQETEAQVRPRSGLALRHGITVLNSPGTIDSDYRGEVMVLLANLGEAPFEIAAASASPSWSSSAWSRRRSSRLKQPRRLSEVQAASVRRAPGASRIGAAHITKSNESRR